jgi:hypothetical protein
MPTIEQRPSKNERIISELLASLGISEESFHEAVAWSLCEHLVTFLAQDRAFLLKIKNDRDFLVKFGEHVTSRTGKKWGVDDLLELKRRLFMALETHGRQPIRYEDWLRLLFTSPLKCTRCGAAPPEAKLEIDHVFAASKGGSSNFENLRFLCQKHNRQKSAKLESGKPWLKLR